MGCIVHLISRHGGTSVSVSAPDNAETQDFLEFVKARGINCTEKSFQGQLTLTVHLESAASSTFKVLQQLRVDSESDIPGIPCSLSLGLGILHACALASVVFASDSSHCERVPHWPTEFKPRHGISGDAVSALEAAPKGEIQELVSATSPSQVCLTAQVWLARCL